MCDKMYRLDWMQAEVVSSISLFNQGNRGRGTAFTYPFRHFVGVGVPMVVVKDENRRND